MAVDVTAMSLKRLGRKLIKLETAYDKSSKMFVKRQRIFKKATKVQKQIDVIKGELNVNSKGDIHSSSGK